MWRENTLSGGIICCRAILPPHSTLHTPRFYPTSDGASGLIEGDAHKAVLEILDVTRQNDAVGHAIVDVFAVWRESGEGLELQAVAQQGRGDDTMLLHISHIDIRGGVEDLQALARHAVEGGDDLLGRVSDITA